MQVFGGRGFLEAFRPGRHFQDTRVARLYEGTDEILTLKIAAAVLGKEYEAFQRLFNQPLAEPPQGAEARSQGCGLPLGYEPIKNEMTSSRMSCRSVSACL